MIRAENLSKHFFDPERGSVAAIDDVSFECRPGEALALLGGNGAGKTTTMRILSTVLKPTGGTASVAGCDVVSDPAGVRKHLGFLSANTGLYDRMTAWEHVIYFGKLFGLEGDHLKSRMETTFAELRMNEFRDKMVSRLSTGMRQKVSIARATIHDPPVLVFDEPTLGLDVLVARSVVDIVERLKSTGKCILYSTHILREVDRLCERIAVLHRGRLLALGTKDELCDQYNADDTEDILFAIVDAADRDASLASSSNT